MIKGKEINDCIIVEYNKIENGRYLRVLKCENYENVFIANPLNLVCIKVKNKKELEEDFKRVGDILGWCVLACTIN